MGLAVGLSACASLRAVSPPSIIRGLTPDEAASDPTLAATLAVRNEVPLQYYKEVERPLQLHTDGPPQLTIALSGGGMRSAIFSLGVLSALHDVGVFPQRTDILSAVSGGGYIASWFYAQEALNQCTADQLLNPKGEAQNALKANSDFIEIKPRHPGSFVALATTIFPMGLVNLLVNGVFGFHANTPTTSPYYMYRFQKTFFAGNAGCSFDKKAEISRSVSWDQIRKKIESNNKTHDPALHTPNFILNSTADFGYMDNDLARRGFNSVYEATPQRFGSEGMRYYCYPETTNAAAKPPAGCEDWRPEIAPLERMAVTSGAAFDTAAISSRTGRLLVSALNFDLGHFFSNPNAASYPKWQLAIPLFYGVTSQYNLDSGGRRMLLTDGGHAENLGVYALLRRLPTKIVVVDAEMDKEHTFGSYHRLKAMALNDLHLVLSVPDIDKAQAGPGPVYYGTVGGIPRGGSKVSSIDLVYIKLPLRSFVKEECDKFSPLAVPSFCDYLRKHKDFPFDGTFTDQSYSPEQFAAYRDLGMWEVERAQSEIMATLNR